MPGKGDPKLKKEDQNANAQQQELESEAHCRNGGKNETMNQRLPLNDNS